MRILKWLSLAVAPVILSGCLEGNKNTDQLCESHEGLQCSELNMNDGQCRIPRTDLIWHRFEVLKQPTDAHKVKEYTLVAAYRKCLELASQLEPIDQSALKQRRFSALMHSIGELDRIVDELSDSKEPETLYFLWSQTGNTDARRSFLQLEGTKALNTAEMQYALATFYTTRDYPKTIALLKNALVLSNGKKVNTEIFKSLASVNHRLGNLEKAYMWAMVAKRFEVPIASQAELSVMYRFNAEKYQELNDIADVIEDAIQEGMFKASLVPTKWDKQS